MIKELMMDTELYVARKDAHKLKVRDLDPRKEYHPCDDNKGEYILMNGPKYCIVSKRDKIEICVTEDIAPKYWEHDYLSASLWFNSQVEAVERHKICTKVFKDVDPTQLLSLLYFFDLEAADYDNLKEVIDAADLVISDIEAETKNIAKRSLLRFFNE